MIGIDFTGRTVLVTGGAGGLGRACVEMFLGAGATAVACDLPSDRLEALVEAFRGPDSRLRVVPLDLSDRENCARLPELACAAADVDSLDVLVNAVGVMRTLPLSDISAEQWSRTLDINLTGVFATIQATAKVMPREARS